MEGSTTGMHSSIEEQADLEVGVPGGAVPPDAGNQPPTKAVEGSSTSYVPSGVVHTVVSRRQLSGLNGALTFGTVSTRA